MTKNEVLRCGFVAIVGRPNVGKSSLLNQLLGEKISITSKKAQTTRHRIIGISTNKNIQIVFIDTPGLHIEEKRAINRLMNRAANSSISDVELILFVVEGTHWTKDDEMVLNKLKKQSIPVILVINKIDNVHEKSDLLPFIQNVSSQMNFAEIMPISVKKQIGTQQLNELIQQFIPFGEHHFPADSITDRSRSFLAAEIIREKLMRNLGEELPYSISVEIEKFEVNQEKNCFDIYGLIWVEREGQKKMVIGNKGSKLKVVGSDARQDMQRLFNHKVYLELWVKVKSGWADDERILNSLGYIDDYS